MQNERYKDLLPTPTARDEKNPSQPDSPRIVRKQERRFTIELNDLAAMNLLPTPTARIYKGGGEIAEKRHGEDENGLIGLEGGDGSPADSGRHGWGSDPGLLPEHRWEGFPTVSPVHRGNDGIPFPLDCLAISPAKWRTESLKAYGNAIVPQVVYRIFQAIEQASK